MDDNDPWTQDKQRWAQFSENFTQFISNENAENKAAMKKWKLKDFLKLAYQIIGEMQEKPVDWKYVINLKFKSIDNRNIEAKISPTTYTQIRSRPKTLLDKLVYLGDDGDLSFILGSETEPNSPVGEVKDEEDERLARIEDRYPVRDDEFRPSYYEGWGKGGPRNMEIRRYKRVKRGRTV